MKSTEPQSSSPGSPDEFNIQTILKILQSSDCSDEAKEKAYRDIYDQYNPHILRFLLSKGFFWEDVLDLTADVWLLAWQRRLFETFSQYKDTVTRDPIKSWLLSAAEILAKKFGRETQKDADLSEVDVLKYIETKILFYDDYTDDIWRLQERKMRRQVGLILRRAKEILSPVEYKVLILTFFEGKNSPEIADILGIKPGTVRQHRYRALQELKSAFTVYDR